MYANLSKSQAEFTKLAILGLHQYTVLLNSPKLSRLFAQGHHSTKQMSHFHRRKEAGNVCAHTTIFCS